MFIKLQDLTSSNPIAINVNNIQAFWYDEAFDCTCVAMNNDYEFRVKETYQEIVDIIIEAYKYSYK